MGEPFEAAFKTTCNQTQRKRVSDFKSNAHRLAYASYRWHNRSGRGSLWGTDFECSLRKYEETQLQRESSYYSYVTPINYQDAEERVYERSEMVCDHYQKSFKIKEGTK
jgi:hypothetical protein